jgi:Ribbon-helix-helix protein, copG family
MRDPTRLPTMKFALDHESIEQLHALADRRGQSVSNLLRELVAQTLQENGHERHHNPSPPR